MRPFLIMFMGITLASCNAPDNMQHYVSNPVIDIPGFHWNYDKHKNTTRVLGPHVRTVEGIGYRLETLYSHEAGLGSRKVTASPTILSATGPFGPVTAAYSYGEEFPVYGFGLIFVKRSRLWKYVCSAPGSLDTSLSHAAGLIEIAACHA